MKKYYLPIILSFIVSFVFVVVYASGSTTIGTNISTGGTLTVSGSATLNGDATLGDTSADLVWSKGMLNASSTLLVAGAVIMYSTLQVDGATTLNTVAYTWPSSDGSSSQYLSTNGSGTLSWSNVASSNWVKETNYGSLTLTASTTIPYWAKSAIYASSTLIVQGLTTLGNASTTMLTMSNGFISQASSTIAGDFLVTGSATTTGVHRVVGNGIFDGNVGIGTSSPYALLSVTGNIVLDSTSITFALSTAATALNLNFPGTATTTVTMTNGINFDSNTFVIDPNSGRVGIGTSSPIEELGITGQLYVSGTDTSTSTIEGNYRVCNDGCTNGFNFYFGNTTSTIEAF